MIEFNIYFCIKQGKSDVLRNHNKAWRWRYRTKACASASESEDFSSIKVSFIIFSFKEAIKLSDAF